ncbi:MAG: FAD-dependent oxidoreductase [Myxococcota bacterium]|nr:FAD-dependent oxidoreductase [Myxococcota bacterium]
MSEVVYEILDADGKTSWDKETDVVICGLGASGSATAVEAGLHGGEVLVLERASGGGGITASAAGHVYAGGGTRVQEAVGVEDSVEAMKAFMMAITPEPDEEKIDLFCTDSVSHFNWLSDNGVPFNNTKYHGKHVMQMTDECLISSGNEEVWPFREKAKPAYRGHKVAVEAEGGGMRLVQELTDKAKSLGAEVVLEAYVQKLLREGDRIAGVRYKTLDGDELNVRARKGVMLCMGHFTGNKEMIQKYAPLLADKRVYLQKTPGCDGVGIQLGLAAGGKALHMDGGLVTCAFYPPESLLKAMLVNKEGKRFVAEDSYHSRTSIFITQQPDGVAYLLVDDEIFGRPFFGGYEPIDAWETLEEMEEGLEIPGLADEVRRYNENAEKGEDPDFHKGEKWLRPLSKPPYAALEASLGKNFFVGFTLGGLKVSKDAEVLREDGSAIEGLYAMGACASNIAQDGTGYSSGTCIAESTYFGRRGARHALGKS